MVEVSNADRIVFPELGVTKGDVVAYYERIAPKALGHVAGRPLSIKRYPKGLSGAGFFQKNVPAHYPPSIARFEVPRSREATKRHRDDKARERSVTVYPVLSEPEQLAYLANQGAIELHVPTALAAHVERPDRLIIDLDPKPGAIGAVRQAAHVVRAALADHGLETVPMATGSKGYHLIAAIKPEIDAEVLGASLHKFATWLAHEHPNELTTEFRIANRGDRVFIDWLRNRPLATGIAPFSLRASARATIATPLSWEELETTEPNAFTIADTQRLCERPDSLAELAEIPADASSFVAGVDAAFERAGLELIPFDRFRS